MKLSASSDPYQQAVFIFKKIEKALHEAGAEMKDVVRITTFVTDISFFEKVAQQGRSI